MSFAKRNLKIYVFLMKKLFFIESKRNRKVVSPITHRFNDKSLRYWVVSRSRNRSSTHAKLSTQGRWELSCLDSITNTNCAAVHQSCGGVSSLQCCGDRRCSNGRCRTVFHRNDKRIPLLIGDDGGSRRTLRGSSGGQQWNPKGRV